MNEEDNPFKDDELVSIQLPRRQYEVLKTMIAREEAYSWFTAALKNSWLWIVGGGILTVLILWDRIAPSFK